METRFEGDIALQRVVAACGGVVRVERFRINPAYEAAEKPRFRIP